MIQNYTVIWDTSKTLLISEFLYWLQVFGYLTIWSCLKKTPQDLKCVVLKHRCPKVPLLCPHVLSVTLVPSPLLPDQFWLGHLRKCNWCKIAPQQTRLIFPHLSSSSWLTTLDEGRNGLVWGGKGTGPGTSVVTHPLVSVQQEVLSVGCSAPAAFPSLALEFSTIFTLIFGVQMDLCSVFLRYWAGSKWNTKPAVHRVDPKSRNNLLQAILCYTNISQNHNCDLILNIKRM